MKKVLIQEMSDRQILKIARQLRVAYKLKKTLRYGTKRDQSKHNESVAEHIFALLFLAQYFQPLEKTARSLDLRKMHEIILFHDFGEIVHGDVPTFEKKEVHVQRERKAAEKIFSSLPEPLGKKAYKRWRDYEYKESPESRFIYALDKVEPVFELLDPVNARTLKRMKTTYELHLSKKMKVTQGYPVMQKFVEVLSRDMARRKLFWEAR